MRMLGHAAASGYDRIIDYIDGNVIAPSQNVSLAQRVIARFSRNWITNSGVRWYHRQEFLCELHAAMHWLKDSRNIFHFIYGENSFRYLSELKRKLPRNKIVCTFHTPEYRFRSLISDPSYLRTIDAVIVVSTAQCAYFSDILGKEKIFFVPHGIDTEVFQSSQKRRMMNNKFNCLYVGTHLRDVDAMEKIILEARTHNAKIHFHVVANETTLARFRGQANVSVYHKIADKELIALYQSADILTLPLLESTANNSILEAIACGLPVITTDLVGTKDYLNHDCAVFVPKNSTHAFIDQITKLMHDPDRCHQMAHAARTRALTLSWPAVAKKIEKLYSEIAKW